MVVVTWKFSRAFRPPSRPHGFCRSGLTTESPARAFPWALGRASAGRPGKQGAPQLRSPTSRASPSPRPPEALRPGVPTVEEGELLPLRGRHQGLGHAMAQNRRTGLGTRSAVCQQVTHTGLRVATAVTLEPDRLRSSPLPLMPATLEAPASPPPSPSPLCTCPTELGRGEGETEPATRSAH